MAYSGVATLTHLGADRWLVVVVETEAGATTEATISGLPKVGRIMTQVATKSAGSAATVAPIIVTTAASALAIDTICEATAAADQSNSFDAGAQYETTNGTLYHRSVCAGHSADDNAIVTKYRIKAGW